MLINNFFSIEKINQLTDNEIVAEIKLNSNHSIFKGHFPNNPIVPGVVSIQMVNEILSEHLETKFMVSTARSIKFSSLIKPNINPNLFFNIKYTKGEKENYKINTKVFFEETTFLKFNGVFSII